MFVAIVVKPIFFFYLRLRHHRYLSAKRLLEPNLEPPSKNIGPTLHDRSSVDRKAPLLKNPAIETVHQFIHLLHATLFACSTADAQKTSKTSQTTRIGLKLTLTFFIDGLLKLSVLCFCETAAPLSRQHSEEI